MERKTRSGKVIVEIKSTAKVSKHIKHLINIIKLIENLNYQKN